MLIFEKKYYYIIRLHHRKECGAVDHDQTPRIYDMGFSMVCPMAHNSP